MTRIKAHFFLSAQTPVHAWGCVLVWMGVIFGLSSIPGSLLPKTTVDALLHRVAHFVEYSILAFLVSRALWQGQTARQIVYWLGSSLLAVFSYATFDEWHQTFVPGRSGQGIDVFGDVVYACCGLFIYFYLIQKSFRKAC